MSSFNELITESDIPILVDFYADWCQPCHAMTPVIEEIAREMSGKIKVIKIDVDKNQTASLKYNVRGIPTFILFHKGNILWRQSGVIPRHVLETEMKKVLVLQ